MAKLVVKKNLLRLSIKILNNKLPLNNCKSVNIPKNIKKMINIAEKLSKIFEFIRVDLYEINDKIYFGELTFLPEAGINLNIKPEKYNKLIGSYWK